MCTYTFVTAPPSLISLSYVLFVGISGSVVYSVIVPLSEASGVSISALNQGTGQIYHGNNL